MKVLAVVSEFTWSPDQPRGPDGKWGAGAGAHIKWEENAGVSPRLRLVNISSVEDNPEELWSEQYRTSEGQKRIDKIRKEVLGDPDKGTVGSNLLTALLVKKKEGQSGKYVVVDGNHRLNLARQLGLKMVGVQFFGKGAYANAEVSAFTQPMAYAENGVVFLNRGHVHEAKCFADEGYDDTLKAKLDKMEDVTIRRLRAVLQSMRDVLISRITRARMLPTPREVRLSGMKDVRTCVRELLQSASAQGMRDARREYREAKRRDYMYSPDQPRASDGKFGSGGVSVPSAIRKEVDTLHEELKGTDLFESAHLVGSWGKGDAQRAPDRKGVGTSDIDIILVAKPVTGNWEARAKARDARNEFVDRVQKKLAGISTRSIELRESEVIKTEKSLRIYAFQYAEKTPATYRPNNAAAWMREKEFFVTDLLDSAVTSKVKGLLVNAMKNGELNSVVADKIWTAFEAYIGDPNVLRDGEPLAPSRLETIARTNLTDAYNHGRMMEFTSEDMLPFMTGIRYSAILDDRTTPCCSYLHGKVFSPTDPDLTDLLPPNHFNCRSIVVPVVVGEKIDQGDFITPAEVGHARQLADAKFLTQENT